MKEKKLTETETKIVNTNNQREARIGQSQSPPGWGLANRNLGYRIAWSQ